MRTGMPNSRGIGQNKAFLSRFHSLSFCSASEVSLNLTINKFGNEVEDSAEQSEVSDNKAGK